MKRCPALSHVSVALTLALAMTPVSVPTAHAGILTELFETLLKKAPRSTRTARAVAAEAVVKEHPHSALAEHLTEGAKEIVTESLNSKDDDKDKRR